METKLLVVYVGVAMVRSEDIDEFVHRVVKKAVPTTFEGEIIIIPVQDVNTKVECINPKYITEPELIMQHTAAMKKLQEELQYQTELLKQKRDE